MRDILFENNEFYHIYDRGIDKRVIFEDDVQLLNFQKSLYLFNDQSYFHTNDPIDKFIRISAPEYFTNERRPFVKIIAYCLMPNHFHLFVQQLETDGISKFLHKIKKAHSWIYNRKYDRAGALFEGKFKAKHIQKEAYFQHMIPYIHLNPLDLTAHNWREGNVTNWIDALKQLSDYQWSSHGVYLGNTQPFPVIDEGVVEEFFPTREVYVQCLKDWSTRESDQGFD